jgi:hypothetical protein
MMSAASGAANFPCRRERPFRCFSKWGERKPHSSFVLKGPPLPCAD